MNTGADQPALGRILQNAGYNVAGAVLPVLVGLIAVPVLLNNLGEARLGIFTLAMGLIGFAGLFDLGLGRALTQTVASALGNGVARTLIADLVLRTVLLTLLLGCCWAVLIWLCADAGLRALEIADVEVANETRTGLYWLAASIPLLLASSSIIGALEGLERFDLVNALRVPLGVLSFALPAAASWYKPSVAWAIAGLAIVRLLGAACWYMTLRRTLRPSLLRTGAERLQSNQLWRYSGWLSVSNVVGPLMAHADRFYLATLFPPALIAHYTVPLDTLFRATSVPLAAMNAAFPALAHSGNQGPLAGPISQRGGVLLLAVWTLPICIAGYVLGPLLSLWLGESFASQALPIANTILLGVLINGFAHIPFSLIQAFGHADVTAKLHLAELPIYAVLLVTLVSSFGILGAAIAWTIRVALDTLLLFVAAALRMRDGKSALLPAALLCPLSALTLLGSLALQR
ncbi:MAG: oligosaccharide flippase family protein [Pseudomonadota bacterium]